MGGILNPIVSSRAQTLTTSNLSGDLFAARSYARWVRDTMRARRERADAICLFESTISEPAADLTEVISEVFSGRADSRYVSVFDGGNPFAIAAVAERYGIPDDQIIATTGATSAMVMALKTLVTPGDHVLVETPGFDLLPQIAREAGAVVEGLARRAPSFKIDLDDLRAMLRTGTKAVVITNLHNPSGALLDDAEIRAIAAVADGVGAVLIIDEVYADFARPPSPRRHGGCTAAGLASNILVVSSLTKVFGLFALKFGWLSAGKVLMARIRLDSPDGDIGVSKLSHAVAAGVLEKTEVFDVHWMRLLHAARPIVTRHAKAMAADGLIQGDVPEFGCMYFPKVTGVADTRVLADRLWSGYGLLVAPGEYFDLPGHIRLGFGSEVELLDVGLRRLHEALRAIRGS
jgi:aspartate/methionine/tyrosine aminotransferase